MADKKAKQEVEKKKPRIIGRIFKWIGLGLLGLLLVAGLLFQAPWKVTALLVVILLACTALPKPFRKWFWLSVGVFILALIVWVFLPDDSEGWRPYTFDEELAALEAKYAIPDEENAAVIYDRLLAEEDKYQERQAGENDIIAELMEKGHVEIPVGDVNELLASRSYSTFYPNFWNWELDRLTRRQPWSSKDYPRVAEWLQQRKDTIAPLLEAAKKDTCRFPIAADGMSLEETMERLSPMRRWATLLIQATNNDFGDGRVKQGLDKNLAVLQMAKHLCQQPLSVALLVAMSIEAIALENLNSYVVEGKLEREHLNLIESTLANIKHDWSADFASIRECEKLIAKNTLSQILYETDPQGKVRLNRNPTGTIRAWFLQDLQPQTYLERKLVKASTVLRWFFVPSSPQELSRIIDTVNKGFDAMVQQDYDWQQEPRKFSMTSVKFNFRCLMRLLAIMQGGSIYGIHDQYLRTAAQQRGSLLLIALRRYKNKHGQWPQSLDNIKDITAAQNLVDPINSGSFVYKLTDDRFNLYSKGENNIDEHGRYRVCADGTGPDDCLIWPPRHRIIKEEYADAE